MQKKVKLRLPVRQLTFVATHSPVYKHRYKVFLLLVICVICLFPRLGFGQTDKYITISLNGVTIKSALIEVQKLSGVKFTYGEYIDKYNAIRVNYAGTHVTVSEAVRGILKETDLKGSVMDDYMVIEEKGADDESGKTNLIKMEIKGRVVDFETSQPLGGATIKLQDKNKTVISDDKGYYSFKELKAGDYILIASYVGYKDNVTKVNVSPDKDVTQDIQMQAENSMDSLTLNTIIVTGQKRARAVTFSTEKDLVTEIRSANAVVSGISNELITKMADRNAAEIVRRIPGITVTDERFIVVRGMNARYNQTYLNGTLAPSTELYTHAFAYDLLPAAIVDRILVYKSPTPDLFGDVTGGSVKIFTKNAKPVRHFDIGVQTGVRTTTTFKDGNTYKGGKMDWLGIDDGTRRDPGKILPSFAESYGKASPSQQEMLKAFSPDLQIGRRRMNPDIQMFINYFDNFKVSQTARLFNFTMINYTNENRIQDVYRQTGNLYSMSFGDALTKDANRIAYATQSSEKGRINLMENLLLKFNERHSLELKNFFLNEGSKNTSVTLTKYNQLPSLDSIQRIRNKDYLESFEQRTLYSGNLTGTHILGNEKQHELHWNLGYNYYQQQLPDQRSIRFFGQNDFLTSNGSNNNTYRDVYLGMINRIFVKNHEENYQASLDYTFTVNHVFKLKAGGYDLFKNRQVNRRFYQVNRAGLEGVNLAGFAFADYGIHDNYGWSDPNLIEFTQEDIGKVWSPNFFPEDGKGLAIYDATAPTDNYVADEKNTAFYAMGDLSVLNKQLNIVGGLRVEDDQQRLSASIVKDGVFIPLLIKKPLTAWLPSLNVTYTFADSSAVLRAGYGKTVNRPEFREISPFSDYDFGNDINIQGNPNLITARIDNYDLRLEWYPRSAGDEMLSAGVFYKNLQHPIEQIRNDQSGSVNFMPTNLSYWNADHAHVYGIEAEIRKSLAFIPGRLFRNFSVLVNGAWIKSEATKAPTTNDTAQYGYYTSFKNRQLQGQAPYVLNAGLFYENPGWGLKTSITYNVSGPTIYAVSTVSSRDARGPDKDANGISSSAAFVRPNLLETPRHLLDFSLTQRLFGALNMKLNIQNLLNQSVRIVEDQNYDNKYDPEKNTGIVQTSYGSSKGPLYKGDNVFLKFNTGRYFLLSFTYAL